MSISGHFDGRKQTHTEAQQKFQNSDKRRDYQFSRGKTFHIERIKSKLKMSKLRERIKELRCLKQEVPLGNQVVDEGKYFFKECSNF